MNHPTRLPFSWSPPLTRRFLLVALTAAWTAPAVRAQAAEDPKLVALAQAAADANSRLGDVNAALSLAQNALAQLEAEGPRSNEVHDRLRDLQERVPAQLESFRAQLKKTVEDSGIRIRSERDQARAQLTREQEEDSARFQREDSTQRRHLKALLDQGPATEALDKQHAEVRSALDRERAQRDFKMQEYRAGLFCSGCNKTQSEFAKGEVFPHAGQTIVRPTEQEILSKERTLQSPIDALQLREDSLRTRIGDVQRKFQNDVDTARKEITERTLAYEARTASNAARRNQAEDDAVRKQAELAAEARSVAASIQAKQQEYAQTVDRWQKEAATRTQAFTEKKAQLNATVRSLAAEKARRASTAITAYQNYLAAQRNSREAAERATAASELAVRQYERVVRDRWLDDTRAEEMARLRQARTSIESGAAPDPAAAAALAQQRVRAQQSRSDYERQRGVPLAAVELAAPRDLGARLTARAQASFANLSDSVKERLQEASEAFGTPRNAVRAVVDHSIDAVASSVRDSLLERLKGEPRSPAQDLAAAAEAAAPDLRGTLKAKLMPVIDEAAVELVVAGRSAQEGRSFTGQELTVERGFARTRLFGANLSKHFDGLLKTYEETMSNAWKMIGD